MVVPLQGSALQDVLVPAASAQASHFIAPAAAASTYVVASAQYPSNVLVDPDLLVVERMEEMERQHHLRKSGS